jgi:hypothetical protein
MDFYFFKMINMWVYENSSDSKCKVAFIINCSSYMHNAYTYMLLYT